MHPTITFQEYLNLEDFSSHRNEYIDGQLLPLDTLSIDHCIINGNLKAILKKEQERLQNYTVYDGKTKVYIEHSNSCVYPDLMVVTEKPQCFSGNPNIVKNPSLVIEVLSTDSEDYDWGNKFQQYKNIPSLTEYILVDQYKPVVEVLRKVSPNTWDMFYISGSSKAFQIECIPLLLELKEIYKNAQWLSPFG